MLAGSVESTRSLHLALAGGMANKFEGTVYVDLWARCVWCL